jgi:hypothetical protein
MADVEPEAIRWLWESRIPAGKLTLVMGDPGLGKSWIALDLAARLSSGRAWPDGAAPAPVADALILSAEDGLADTIRPRLDSLGADQCRIHYLAGLRVGDVDRSVTLLDIAVIEQAIVGNRVRLVTIDPLSAYLGDTDSHRDADVRALLAPLAALAERTSVAIVGIMHLTKGRERPAVHRAIGSIAFAAAARLVHAVAADPERPERRIFAPVKQNICAPAPSLAFSLREGCLTWEAQPIPSVDIDLLLAGPARRRQQTEAEEVIAELLNTEDWPLLAKQALEAGRQRGIPDRTLQWTARRMGIRIVKTSFKGGWVWHRPDPGSP